MNHELNELTGLVHALAVLREVSPRSHDAVLAVGEIVSSRIVAAALADARRAERVGGRAHGAGHRRGAYGAAPDMIETCERAREQWRPASAARLGSGARRLHRRDGERGDDDAGRGGSDYSAAIFGACLGVDEIQIWTDVDGMLTADPRIVPQPRVVPQLTFAEASELAYFGAKVLHPSTILPAVAKNIPVRILNSRRPENAGTRITADGRPAGGQLAAIACKRDVTVIDITSTRMLMAHGFLRRLFEVFERFKTAVDVVTTSEVSVSVTVDDTRRLEAILDNLRNFAEAGCERDMAIICAVGENLTADADAVRPRGHRAGTGAAAPRLAGGLAAEYYVRAARRGRASCDDASARDVLLMSAAVKILLVGHGKMGQLVGELSKHYGCDVAGVIDPMSPARRRSRRGPWRGVDVAIDFSTAESVMTNAPVLARRGINLVIGTTGWPAHEAALRQVVAEAGVGIVVAPNFSTGVVLFEAIVARAARLFAPQEEFGAFLHEAHHAAKKDAPSGTALLLKRAMEQAGFPRPIDVSSTRAGLHSRHASRSASTGRAETITLSHAARDRTAFARGALTAAKWIHGKRGWFTMQDVLGVVGLGPARPGVAATAEPQPWSAAWENADENTIYRGRHRTGQPVHSQREPRRSGGASSRAPADRRGRAFSLSLRDNRREPDADGRRARCGPSRSSLTKRTAGCRSWLAPADTTRRRSCTSRARCRRPARRDCCR